MKVVLKLSGHTVELEDFISQEVVEAVEDLLLSRVNMADESWARVSNEEVAKVFPALYDECMKEKDDEKREVMFMKAKKRVVSTDPKRGGVSAAEFNKSLRVEVEYMIKEITLKDGKKIDGEDKKAVSKFVVKLPTPDYKQLRAAVDKIDNDMKANLKNTGEV